MFGTEGQKTNIDSGGVELGWRVGLEEGLAGLVLGWFVHSRTAAGTGLEREVQQAVDAQSADGVEQELIAGSAFQICCHFS